MNIQVTLTEEEFRKIQQVLCDAILGEILDGDLAESLNVKFKLMEEVSG